MLRDNVKQRELEEIHIMSQKNDSDYWQPIGRGRRKPTNPQRFTQKLMNGMQPVNKVWQQRPN